MRLAIEEQLDRHSLDAQRRAIEVACAERKAKGLHNGLVPFGYRTGSAGIAEPDPATQDGAIRAFEMAATGAGYTKIAKELNVCSFRTAGNMRRDVFTKDSVRDILANRFYLGELPIIEPRKSRRIRDRQPGQHPALIDGATFDAARQAIGARASSSGAQRREASIYSLSGLLRCAHCSERMRVMRTEKGRVRYHCRSKAQGLGCTGSGSFLDTDEQQIVADLAAFAFPAEPIGEYPLRGCLGKRTHHRVRPAPAGTRAAVPGADRCGATNRGAEKWNNPSDRGAVTHDGRGDPDGSRDRICHFHRLVRWSIPRADDTTRRASGRRPGTLAAADRAAAAHRVLTGAPLRDVAIDLGVSHETLRRWLRREGIITSARPVLALHPPRRERVYRLPGRGRSRAIAPEELPDLAARHQQGASVRSLARSVGVSHETMRRTLAGVAGEQSISTGVAPMGGA